MEKLGFKEVSVDDSGPLRGHLEVASRGGAGLAVDTAAEKDAHIRGLDVSSQEYREMFARYRTLTEVPNYMVNIFYRGEFGGATYGDLVELPNNAAIGFFVFVGGFGYGKVPVGVHFAAIDRDRWNEIIKPLLEPAPSPDQERKLLKGVLRSVEVELERRVGVRVGDEYVDSMARNCFDKSAGVMQTLLALKHLGLLRFHHVDPSRRYFQRGFEHRAARLVETVSGADFVVDTWNDKKDVLMLPGGLWFTYLKATFEVIPRGAAK